MDIWQKLDTKNSSMATKKWSYYRKILVALAYLLGKLARNVNNEKLELFT